MNTLACGHVAHAGHSRVCPHLLRPAEDEDVDFVRLLTGRGLDADLCCTTCDQAREKGVPVSLAVICEGCVALYDDEDAGCFSGWRGEPGIGERPEPVDTTVVTTPLPVGMGAVRDIAPLPAGWLILTETGRLFRFDPGSGAHERVAKVRLPAETGKRLKQRLHTSPDGRFAAVVNDFGRYGQVLDLTTGKVTLKLDGGGYHNEQVPLSLAFVDDKVVHRTAWNRLDVSEASTGRLLTAREMNREVDSGMDRDRSSGLFRGELRVSPNGRWIADDSWAWAPAGVPYLWDLRRWLDEDVWESDDGPSRRRLCQRFYLWNTPMCWVGDNLLAVSGLGSDDEDMLAGVRIFDAGSGVELHTFAGPEGDLFSAGRRLFAAAPGGLEIWDPFTGERTARIPGFRPTRHHRAAGELAEIRDAGLLRWRIHERLLVG
ncbi:hypothetical protein [Actinoplanes sp. GCM10030250]|uniref:hypothetical protein n=1 Tax=Actinoplanes sp. GCM10030250 TaxID=3273376 RepID=UPI003619D9BB